MLNAKRIYFPACKVDAAFPEGAIALKKYLTARWGLEALECCRTDREKINSQVIAVVLCHTCAAILEESSQANSIEYVWSLIDQDEVFAFPDYGGERITLQDCTMAKAYPEVMENVRNILRKMNFEIVELHNNREQAQFCGLLTTPVLAANAALAPKRFGQKGIFNPLEPKERKIYLEKHVQQFKTERAVCYCKACHGALALGGAKVVHLLELLFPAR